MVINYKCAFWLNASSDLAVNATITELQHVGEPGALACAGDCVQGLVIVQIIPAIPLKTLVITHHSS